MVDTLLFKSLRGTNDFTWSDEWEMAFEALKRCFTHTPTLAKPLEGDDLELYQAILEATISLVLLRSEGDA